MKKRPPVPYRFITGLDPVAQREIERDFASVTDTPIPYGGTIFIAPADATVYDQQAADIILPGVSDEVTLNALLATHEFDRLRYCFFAGTVSATGTINPNFILADWIGLSRPTIIGTTHLLDINGSDTVDRGTRIVFDTGGTYLTVETIDPEEVASCMFGMAQGSLRNLRITGSNTHGISVIADVQDDGGSTGASIEMQDLWLEQVDYFTGGGNVAHGVFRNIWNTTPTEGVSA